MIILNTLIAVLSVLLKFFATPTFFSGCQLWPTIVNPSGIHPSIRRRTSASRYPAEMQCSSAFLFQEYGYPPDLPARMDLQISVRVIPFNLNLSKRARSPTKHLYCKLDFPMTLSVHPPSVRWLVVTIS